MKLCYKMSQGDTMERILKDLQVKREKIKRQLAINIVFE